MFGVVVLCGNSWEFVQEDAREKQRVNSCCSASNSGTNCCGAVRLEAGESAAGAGAATGRYFVLSKTTCALTFNTSKLERKRVRNVERF